MFVVGVVVAWVAVIVAMSSSGRRRLGPRRLSPRLLGRLRSGSPSFLVVVIVVMVFVCGPRRRGHPSGRRRGIATLDAGTDGQIICHHDCHDDAYTANHANTHIHQRSLSCDWVGIAIGDFRSPIGNRRSSSRSPMDALVSRHRHASWL